VSGEALHARGGAIVAAICIDQLANADGTTGLFSNFVTIFKLSDERFTHADVLYTMVDGKLPNLDLVNLVIKLLHKDGITPTIFGYVSSLMCTTFNKYLFRKIHNNCTHTHRICICYVPVHMDYLHKHSMVYDIIHRHFYKNPLLLMVVFCFVLNVFIHFCNCL
jgi:hypothetical protein